MHQSVQTCILEINSTELVAVDMV